MNRILTLLLVLMTFSVWAQDYMFVHTATNANSVSDLTLMDHPMLNNNPNAQMVVSHAWNPPGNSGTYNTHRSGLFYSGGDQKWGIYNEDGGAIEIGTSYFVYIEQGTEMFEHIADAGNQGTSDSYTVLNHPDLNGNPDAQVVSTTYYNPNSSRNDATYGTWYDGSSWIIYKEDLSAIEFGDAFIVAINSPTTIPYRHVASASTISSNWTVISHPDLDGNPDARFVFFHNWGETGQPSNVIVDEILGAWYTGSNWAIFTEDLSAFPQDAEFDLLIYNEDLGTDTFTDIEAAVAPNPIRTAATFSAMDVIDTITITNIAGQQIMEIKGTDTQQEIDLSNLASGQYFAHVQTSMGSEVIKLIKL